MIGDSQRGIDVVDLNLGSSFNISGNVKIKIINIPSTAMRELSYQLEVYVDDSLLATTDWVSQRTLHGILGLREIS